MHPVFLLSNAIPPNSRYPSAAPGLRSYGLKAGLAANGIAATVVLAREMVARQVERWDQPTDAIPEFPDALVLDADRIMQHLTDHAPATVLVTNWAGMANLEAHPLLTVGLDLFSPTVLEHRYRDVNIESVIRNKRAALQTADFCFVNGARKIPYYHGWLASCGLDLRDRRLEAVNMSLPFDFRGMDRPNTGSIRINVSGYNQPWAPLGPVLSHLERLAVRAPVEVDVVAAPDYWKQSSTDDPLAATLQRLESHPQFRILPPMDYFSLGQLLQSADLVIDLFDRNIEREYSMSTRAVVALAHGVPVVHPDFTELGSLLKSYNAGWTSGSGVAGYSGLLDQAIAEIQAQPETLAEKKRGARSLAEAHFNPVAEAAKLLPYLRS